MKTQKKYINNSLTKRILSFWSTKVNKRSTTFNKIYLQECRKSTNFVPDLLIH